MSKLKRISLIYHQEVGNIINKPISKIVMIFSIGIFAIMMVWILKCNVAWNKKLQSNKLLKKVTEFSNCDKIFRLMQYICIFIIGDHRLPVQIPNDIDALFLTCQKYQYLEELDRLKRAIRQMRKVTKILFRGPELIKNLVNKRISLPNFKIGLANGELVLLQWLKFMEISNRCVAQICLIIFYFTDHHESYYEWGIINSNKQIHQSIDDVGILFRIAFSVFGIFSIWFASLKIFIQLQKKGKQQLKKSWTSLRLNLIQFCAHVADILLFYGIYCPGFLPKKHIGFLGMTAAELRLIRIFY